MDIPQAEYFTREDVLNAATWLGSALREGNVDESGLAQADTECLARAKRLRLSDMWYPIDGSERHVVFYIDGCAKRVKVVVELDPDVRALHAPNPQYSPIVVDEPL